MQYTQEITLDLNSNTAYTTVGAKQGDNNTREVIVHITSNGEDYNLEEQGIDVAYFRFRKPDGKAVINQATINKEKNTISIYFTAQTLAVSGRGYADITLQQGSEILSTVSFIIIIMSSPQVANEAVSSNEFGLLNAIVSDATNIIHEAEAWAVGTRGGQEVFSEDEFSNPPIVEATAFSTASINEAAFKSDEKRIGHKPGTERTFKFTFKHSTWQLVITTKDGGTETVTDPEIISSLDSYYITTDLGDRIPNEDDSITVIWKEKDLAADNYSKYWAEQAHQEETKIENMTVSAEESITADVIKEDLETGSYNLHFYLPKGDKGDIDLMSFYIDLDIESPTYGQIINVKPDSVLTTHLDSYPDTIVLKFNKQIFQTAVNNNFQVYNFIWNGSNWTLNNEAVDLLTYGIDYVLKPNRQLFINDTISINYFEQVKFSINNNGELQIEILEG